MKAKPITASTRHPTFFLPKSKSLALKCTISGSGAPMASAQALAMPSKVTKRSPLMLNTSRLAAGLPMAATKAVARSFTWPSCVTWVCEQGSRFKAKVGGGVCLVSGVEGDVEYT